ncbi:hypothetical protein KST17_00440 [Fusobacterium canifelinum]|uniref:hypothetical protein n=1 Tax=Fusobacterium canifelinum TaxID=285729 RepID=UPI0030D3154F
MKKSLFLIFFLFLILSSFSYSNYPTPDYKYYIVKEPMVVKNLELPVGARIVYFDTSLFGDSESSRPLKEKNIYQIFFPDDKPLIWGGVPVSLIERFFNRDMKGFTVYPELGNSLESDKNKSKLMEKSEFLKLWFMWAKNMHVDIKDEKDWSFNPDNMVLGGKADTRDIDYGNLKYFQDENSMEEHLRKLNEAARNVK